mmetsp:Transcript_1418/g.5492  ORF Transcript_1418/g.5492 Transcript_1418/m.5492 type:complete len:222 (+) Transcript_1418:789-1454(+)
MFDMTNAADAGPRRGAGRCAAASACATTAGAYAAAPPMPARWPSWAINAARDCALIAMPPESSASSRQSDVATPAPWADEPPGAVGRASSSAKATVIGLSAPSSMPAIRVEALNASSASANVAYARPPATTRTDSTAPNGASTVLRSSSEILGWRLPMTSLRRWTTLASCASCCATVASCFARKFFSASEALTRIGNFWKSGSVPFNMSTIGTDSRSAIST